MTSGWKGPEQFQFHMSNIWSFHNCLYLKWAPVNGLHECGGREKGRESLEQEGRQP